MMPMLAHALGAPGFLLYRLEWQDISHCLHLLVTSSSPPLNALYRVQYKVWNTKCQVGFPPQASSLRGPSLAHPALHP
jgi:hypothetical protein